MLPTQKADAMKLGVETDNASFDRLEQRLNVLDDKLLILRRTNDAWAKSTTMTAESIRAAYQKAGDQVSRLTQVMDAAKSRAAGNYDALRNELMGGGSTGGAQQAGGKGLNVEGLRRTGGALSQLGLEAIGEPVQRLGDFAQVVKEVGTVGASAGAALGVAAAAGVVFVGGLELIKKQYEGGNAIINTAIPKLNEYYNIIETGTSKQIQQDLIKAQKDLDSANKQLAVTSGATGTAFKSAQQAYGDLGARILFGLGSTGLYNDTLKKTDASVSELTDKQQKAQAKVDALTQALGSAEVAANDAAEAEQKLAEARIKQIDENIGRDVKQNQLLRDASSKQVESMIDDSQALIRSIDENKHALEGRTDQVSIDRLAALNEQEQKEKQNLDFLLSILKPVVEQREKEADAIKKSNETSKAARAAITKENEALAGEYEKHGENVQNILQNDLDARASIEQKYQDALVKAAEDAVQAATNALQKLEEQRDNLATGLSRDLQKSDRDAADQALTDQIKAQRTERDDLVAHLRRLKDIRNSSQAEEQTAMWDRSILSLIKLRIQKSQQMDQENQDYQRKQQDDQRAAKDEVDDQKRQQAIQRRERLIAYAEANGDAEKQYRRELTQAAQAKQRALELAASGKIKEIELEDEKVKRLLATEDTHAKAEIKLIGTVADVRLKALQAEADAARKMIGATANSATQAKAEEFRHAISRAPGGPVQAGQLYQVNDDAQQNTESFNGVSFPPGLGLFIPAQSGSVRSSRSTVTHLTVPVQISGVTDPQAVARIAVPLIQKEIVAFMDEVDNAD